MWKQEGLTLWGREQGNSAPSQKGEESLSKELVQKLKI